MGIFCDALAIFKAIFGQEAAVTPGLELRAAAERHARGEGGAFIGFVQVRFETDSIFLCCCPESNFCCVCRIKCLVKGFFVTMF